MGKVLLVVVVVGTSKNKGLAREEVGLKIQGKPCWIGQRGQTAEAL